MSFDAWFDDDEHDVEETRLMQEELALYESEIYMIRQNEYIEHKREMADLRRKELKENGSCSKPYWHL